MKRPKVTFLMQAYNAESFISKAIESVRNQTENEVELLIRNNGSTDRTGDIIRFFASRDSRIHWVENKVNGVSDEGIPAFQEGWWPLRPDQVGEYVSILDADDWISPEFTSRMYEAAQASEADLVVGGAHFVDESTNKIIGHRIPPKLIAGDIQKLQQNFSELYSSLRTWWGKLYRSDVFLSHYRECWKIKEPLEWIIDTHVVLEYFGKSNKVVTVQDQLYYFLVNPQSTYSRRPLDWARGQEADLGYSTALRVLNELGLATEENKKFLINIHWGYLIDAMGGLQANASLAQSTPLQKLNRLSLLVNNSLAASYMHSSYPFIFESMKKMIAGIIHEDGSNHSVWSSFLARLYYFENNLKQQPTNSLSFPILISCLCDAQNRNHFGFSYLTGEARHWAQRVFSKGERKYMKFGDELRKHMFGYPVALVDEINEADRTDSVVLMEEQLKAEYEAGNYEAAFQIIEEISKVSPFNMNAMYYRICGAVLAQDWELVGVLTSAARVLWPNNRNMQLLYWDIFSG